MGIPVKLEAFEGPLDLLLHLIDKNKVNIYDIPIAQITEQYLEYIKEMKRQDLDVMSEFLVMAATLLDIKSKMLLPKEVDEEGEEIEEMDIGEGVDEPRYRVVGLHVGQHAALLNPSLCHLVARHLHPNGIYRI